MLNHLKTWFGGQDIELYALVFRKYKKCGRFGVKELHNYILVDMGPLIFDDDTF